MKIWIYKIIGPFIVLSLIAIWVFFDLTYFELNTSHFKFSDTLSILGMLFLLSGIVERAVESLLFLWKGEKIVLLNAGFEEKESIADSEKSEEASVSVSKIEEEERKRKKAVRKLKNKAFSSFWSFFFGLLISISGFNVLTTFFEINKDEITQSELKNNNELSEVIQELYALDSLVLYTQTTDSLGVSYEISNVFNKKTKSLINKKELLSTNIINAKPSELLSKNIQVNLFHWLGILLTALMLSGGSEAIHSLFSLFSSFTEMRKNSFIRES